MEHRKLILNSLVVACAIGSVQQAFAVDLTMDHQYEDVDKTHTDEVVLSQKFASGFKLSGTLKFQPEEQANGNSGLAFRNEKWHESKVGMSYSLHVSDSMKLEPAISLVRKQNTYKYKPSLKLKVDLTDTINTSVRVRKEITDTSGKSLKKVNRLDVSISKKIQRASVGYEYTYYHGNQDLYNNSRHDHEQKIEFDYDVTKRFTPYIAVKNEAVSASNDRRQTEFEIGFTVKI